MDRPLDVEPPAVYPAVEYLDIPPMDPTLACPPASFESPARQFVDDLVARLGGDVDELRAAVSALGTGRPDPAA